MKDKLKLVFRVLLGLMMLVFGLNKFFSFMPMPPMPELAGQFMGALVKSGYLMTIIAVVEIITGAFILFDKYLSLALVVLFPVMLNAFLFHLFLDPAGIMGAGFALFLIIYLMYQNKSDYASLFKSN